MLITLKMKESRMKAIKEMELKLEKTRLPDDLRLVVKHTHERLLLTIDALVSRGLETSRSVRNFVDALRANGPRAGAFVACLLAEPFKITDPHLIEEVTFASLCLDAFSHAVDDATDKRSHDDGTLIHT